MKNKNIKLNEPKSPVGETGVKSTYSALKTAPTGVLYPFSMYRKIRPYLIQKFGIRAACVYASLENAFYNDKIKKQSDGSFYFAHSSIINEFGLSTRTIRNKIKLLNQNKLFKMKRKHHNANYYLFVPEQEMHTSCARGAQVPVLEVHPIEDSTKERVRSKSVVVLAEPRTQQPSSDIPLKNTPSLKMMVKEGERYVPRSSAAKFGGKFMFEYFCDEFKKRLHKDYICTNDKQKYIYKFRNLKDIFIQRGYGEEDIKYFIHRCIEYGNYKKTEIYLGWVFLDSTIRDYLNALDDQKKNSGEFKKEKVWKYMEENKINAFDEVLKKQKEEENGL